MSIGTRVIESIPRLISPRIAIRDQSGLEHEVVLYGSQLLLGRAPDCDLVLDTEHVAARHARLCWNEGRMLVKDLGSDPGILMDGQRMPANGELLWSPGAELQIGEHLLRLTISERSAASARPAADDVDMIFALLMDQNQPTDASQQ